MIRLLVALFVNQFAIALRAHSGRQLRGERFLAAHGGASSAVVESSSTSVIERVFCGDSFRGRCIDFVPSNHPRRFPITTRLERFFADRKISASAVCHQISHVETQDRFPDVRRLYTEQLLEIRKGQRQPRPNEKKLIAAAVTNLLGELVTVEMLFTAEAAR